MSIRRSNRIVSLPAVDYSRKKAYSVKRKVEPTITKAKRTKTVKKTNAGEKAAGVAVKEIVNIQENEVADKDDIKVSTTTTKAVVSRAYDFSAAIGHLKKADPKLGEMMDAASTAKFRQRILDNGPLNPFRDLATHIIYQQIHGTAAKAILNRFVKLFDPSEEEVDLPKELAFFPTPEMVIAKPIPELRTAGLSQRKAEYIVDLATHFVDKRILPNKFKDMTDEEISVCLTSVRGIGQWTVDMYLIFHLGHPDVLPLGDLGVRKGMAVHFGLMSGKQAVSKGNNKQLPSPDDMVRLTEHWKPYRSVGSWYMWKVMDGVSAK
ncbi:hypothetical protein K450DRAFT_227335 [Umbelopsis ramanniana AG]|uniref:HhH-GPD domain-containing protein n=1 Tax=Umbelopsis ramanniana AG TaxID=1314678 RepID=A0AAD5EEZ5_UMBRA|nr:uncharacterized protein K450DRAFT_227335 [Umbelopsis ramanniana AG]KAI8582473.1 hypothetical protein K450DRAFT_227335 [Umbelopsis ramanniana AG]